MRLAGIFVVGLLAGCSIVFNTNDLPRVSDAPLPDAPPPTDAVVFDVNPAGLTLDSVEPAALDEGTGTSGGRPAVVVIHGSNLDGDAKIEIVDGTDPVPAGLIVGTPTISHQHELAAITVTVPVIDSLADGAHLSLAVRVTNAGAPPKTIPIQIDGLDPFAPVGNVDAGSLKPLYATATFASNVHFTGTKPAHVRVTGGITISATVDANASGQNGGPGGCKGGGASAPGDCTPGGGGGGDTSTTNVSGGGGGFGAAGTAGGGGVKAGGAGAMTGDPMLVQLDYSGKSAGNRGNGGGGGGGALLGIGAPGVGGGGGGTIELTAGGTIHVTAGGVHAAGGDGTTGGGALGAGDGGGGSGGAILIRSGGGVTSSGTWITAPAGGNSGGSGGAGAIGRVRVDTPSGAVAGMADPTATQGASWATGAAAPTIVRTPTASFALIGGNGGTYGVFVAGGTETTVSLSGTTMKTVMVALTAGLNRVCADAAPGNSGSDVAVNCIDVAYVP